MVVLAACGSSDRPAEKPTPGTSKTCAAICKDSSPRTADYVKCLEGCPGPETTGELEVDAGLTDP